MTDDIEALRARVKELEGENARLMVALAEATEENLWGAFNCGVERGGEWIDAGMADARMLQRELGLDAGKHDALMMRRAIPVLARKLAARAAGIKTEAGE
jgi:hypothetical protein